MPRRTGLPTGSALAALKNELVSAVQHVLDRREGAAEAESREVAALPRRPDLEALAAGQAVYLRRKFGQARFRRLVQLFEQGTSGEQIAREYGATRQAVNLWRRALGRDVGYELFKAVRGILRMSDEELPQTRRPRSSARRK